LRTDGNITSERAAERSWVRVGDRARQRGAARRKSRALRRDIRPAR
jgi:hypothetical protein